MVPVLAQPQEPLVVQVGGRLVEGWMMEPACPTCGGTRVYFMAYDAICCPDCNVWLELLCPDPDCVHCRLRPARPMAESRWTPEGLAIG